MIAASIISAYGFMPDDNKVSLLVSKLALTMIVFHLASDGHPSWPYTVDYAPDHPTGSFYFASGDARNGNGTFLTAREALTAQWRGDLEAAGGLWLLPFLERLAAGETVEKMEILDAYEAIHGAGPQSSQWPD